MSSISEAHMFAAGAHGGVGQKRKYTGEDYINHPVAVREIVALHDGTVEMQIAARYSKLTDRSTLMNNDNEVLKEMIAKLLEDARRLQVVEPNAGTQSRIDEAMKLLKAK
ncbi:hypothetical protein AAW06_20340 [Escherichia coli]|nr:hypothetical protein AAW06_20340 [Escherichia coli]